MDNERSSRGSGRWPSTRRINFSACTAARSERSCSTTWSRFLPAAAGTTQTSFQPAGPATRRNEHNPLVTGWRKPGSVARTCCAVGGNRTERADSSGWYRRQVTPRHHPAPSRRRARDQPPEPEGTQAPRLASRQENGAPPGGTVLGSGRQGVRGQRASVRGYACRQRCEPKWAREVRCRNR